MKFSVKNLAQAKSDLLVLPLFEDEKKCSVSVSKEIDSQVKQLIKNNRIGSHTHFYPAKEAFESVMVYGLGKKEKYSVDSLRKSVAKALKCINNHKFSSISIALPLIEAQEELSARAIVDGVLLSNYSFDNYKTKKDEKHLKTVDIITSDDCGVSVKDLQKAVKLQQSICDGVYTARDLENMPSSDMTPSILADFAVKMCKSKKVSITVLDEKKIIAKKMGCLHGVSRGSVEEPRFIVMEYGKEFKKSGTTAIVGKGITFDSGGISLKPGADMDQMKMDMSGAAATIGIMEAVASLGIKKHIYCIVPTAENMPSGTAYKPGDILTAMNGKTVEILNTDAEGRLILADALCYAADLKPKVILDLATLTGACLVALGTVAAGIITNNDDVYSDLQGASKDSGEKIWQLPSFDEYREQIKSKIADLQNIGGRYAGTITAGLFLEEFVNDIPWAHIDIAGTAMNDKDHALCPKGGSGFGVKLVVEYLLKK